jgi:hypothetical protein
MRISTDIIDYIDNKLDEISGWLAHEAAYFTAYLLSYQKEINMAGNILEIGVFHGKYLSLLYLFSGKKETVYGIDAFLNGTHKRALSNRVFDNIARFCGKETPTNRVFDNIVRFCGNNDHLKIIVKNSLNITPEVLRKKVTSDVRFISIDGGHTSDTVYHDLCLAKSVVKDGGIIALDDAFNHTPPGVNEGMHNFMLSENKDGHLTAFAHCYNKAFFTTSKHHKEYLQLSYDFLKDMEYLPACQRTKQRIDMNRYNDFVPEMYGHEIVSFL